MTCIFNDQGCGVLVFLWDSDSDFRVRKFRTPDSDSDSRSYCIVWHTDSVLKDDLREIKGAQ